MKLLTIMKTDQKSTMILRRLALFKIFGPPTSFTTYMSGLENMRTHIDKFYLDAVSIKLSEYGGSVVKHTVEIEQSSVPGIVVTPEGDRYVIKPKITVRIIELVLQFDSDNGLSSFRQQFSL